MCAHALLASGARAIAPRTIKPKSNGLQTFARLLGSQADQVARTLRSFYHRDDPEGPHQARVALRRLRSLLRLYRPKLAAAPVRAIEDLARTEMRRIGPLRDADVLLAEVLPMAVDALGECEAKTALRDRVATHRATLAKRILSGRAALASADRLFELHEFVAEQPWRPRERAQRKLTSASARRLAAFALDRAFTPARRLGDQLEDLSLEDRHELRKRLKTLRYAVELHAPLYRVSTTTTYLTILRKLQNVFGAMNDAANAEILFQIAPAREFSDTVEEIVEMQRARMRKDWPKAQRWWSKFSEQPQFW